MRAFRFSVLTAAVAFTMALAGHASAEIVKGKVSKIEGKSVTVTTHSGSTSFEVTGAVTAKVGDAVEVDVVDGKAAALAPAKLADKKPIEKKAPPNPPAPSNPSKSN